MAWTKAAGLGPGMGRAYAPEGSNPPGCVAVGYTEEKEMHPHPVERFPRSLWLGQQFSLSLHFSPAHRCMTRLRWMILGALLGWLQGPDTIFMIAASLFCKSSVFIQPLSALKAFHSVSQG